MRYFICLLSLLLLFLNTSWSQTQITWETLQDVEYDMSYDSTAGYVVMTPLYGETLTALHGKSVFLKGYVLPMDTDGSSYVLSAFPFSSCFFCGGGGKETVVELEVPEGTEYKVDQILTFSGKLKLNTDPFGLNYILTQAREFRTDE